MSKPSEQDNLFAKRVMRYLNGTRKMKLRYERRGEKLVGYSDASYAEDKADRKSTGGYTFVAKEAMWLKSLIQEVDKNAKNEPIIIFEDNQSTITFAKNPIQSERTKHIEVRHHYIRQKVAEGKIEVKYMPTEEQIADIFTKSLCRVKHEKFTRALGLVQ